MKRMILLLVLFAAATVKVNAAEMSFAAPVVPESGAAFLERAPESFSEGIRSIALNALPYISPALSEAAGACIKVIGTILLLSIVGNFVNLRSGTINLAGTIAVATTLLKISGSLIPLGSDTVQELDTYGKLLLPVMTGALAAQGSVTTSGALYMGTAFFNSLLIGAISRILMPGIYVYLALAVSTAALDDSFLSKLKGLIKGSITWFLKIVLYVFTGYMAITGTITGTTDAMAMKAAKVTISGVVPVVGGILSDASEAVLVSASMMKNAAGVYGILAVIAITIGPFVRLGAQYLMVKLTAAVCGVLGQKPLCGLIEDISVAMGLILAMTAAVGFMILISTVCFLRVTT